MRINDTLMKIILALFALVLAGGANLKFGP